MPLLEVEKLQVDFGTGREKRTVIKEISFHVDAGEVVGIVGESGCGKSLTAQAILRLLPQAGHISAGKILFQGEDLLLKSEREMQAVRGAKIGIVFQDPTSFLNPLMKIGEQLTEGLRRHHGISKAAALEIAEELLSQMGLADPKRRLGQYPHEFSGGMRQRILIAMALACEPPLLIADEPTTALDVTTQAQILELIKEIQKQRKMGLLFITHDLGVVAGLCDRVVVMQNGEIIETAPVDELFSHPRHPFTQELLRHG